MNNKAVAQRVTPHLIVLVLLLPLLLVIIRTAWLSDDAYITMRTVDNFVSGYGLRWNVIERVQSYTHPLWFLAIATTYFFTHEVYFTLIWLSFITSILAIALVLYHLINRPTAAILATALFISSKAFIDFTTSGLETPLSYLLFALFLTIWFQSAPSSLQKTFWLTFTGSLFSLNRLDTLILVLPALAVSWWQASQTKPWRHLSAIILAGFIPLIAWHILSVVYYGLPFPNTAYAKLFGAHMSAATLIQQGIHYFEHSLFTDPITLLTIAAAFVIVAGKNHLQNISIAIGIFLYLLYTLKIGGDFMSGRFLTLPFLAATILIARHAPPKLYTTLISTLVVVIGLMLTPYPSLTSNQDYDIHPEQGYQLTHGIADERSYYYQRTGLLSKSRTFPTHGWIDQPKAHNPPLAVLPHESFGHVAFAQGPQIHVIDQLGLSDPLLSRLPQHPQVPWRVGHTERKIPNGYADSVISNHNQICHPALKQLYTHIQRLTREPLFTTSRWQSIWLINTGQLDHLIDAYHPLQDCPSLQPTPTSPLTPPQ